ncbi:unnamed protein product [Chondrus crispus]|uniref:Uncharacterized protein n=1 Tax=Chondrus crispus TaxID=2769 RepID=R7QTQ7_CHOCR|nr:unnamed protein product [Chondrus crispus]CDF40760.1 unnamed protein product [Chondrus crispus]|eukprot:XP_005711054.1 unnamed protein product [Chondrus crispus]
MAALSTRASKEFGQPAFTPHRLTSGILTDGRCLLQRPKLPLSPRPSLSTSAWCPTSRRSASSGKPTLNISSVRPQTITTAPKRFMIEQLLLLQRRLNYGEVTSISLRHWPSKFRDPSWRLMLSLSTKERLLPLGLISAPIRFGPTISTSSRNMLLCPTVIAVMRYGESIRERSATQCSTWIPSGENTAHLNIRVTRTKNLGAVSSLKVSQRILMQEQNFEHVEVEGRV